MTIEQKIGAEMRRIVKGEPGATLYLVMSGVVVAGSVDMTNRICSVQLTGDDDGAPMEHVTLNVVEPGNGNGLVLYPADGSHVLVCQIDGGGGYQVIWCSDLAKVVITVGSSSVTITDGLIQLNDGSLGGLVEVAALVGKMNVLENDLNAIKTVFKAGWVPVANDGGAALKLAAAAWAGQSITDTVRGDIENKNVTHG